MGIFDRFPYSSTHEMNLDFMLGKATEIAESLQEIDTHKDQAEQAATNAAQSAASAAEQYQAARGAAIRAEVAQGNAENAAADALQHKTDAADAADRAEAASDLADEAVEQAQTAAQNASTAADGAISSASAAETRINNLAASLPSDFTDLNTEVNNFIDYALTGEYPIVIVQGARGNTPDIQNSNKYVTSSTLLSFPAGSILELHTNDLSISAILTGWAGSTSQGNIGNWAQDINYTFVDGIAVSITFRKTAGAVNVTPADVNPTLKISTALSNSLISAQMLKKWKPGKVACIGDSLTKGVDVGSHVIAENYPYFMGKMLECEVLNYGVSGADTMEYWNDYLNTFTFDSTIDAVLIMLGTNGGGIPNTLATDVYPYTNYNDYANTYCGDYCKIIRKIIELTGNHAQVYLITPPYTTYSTEQLNRVKIARETIKEIGLYFNLPVIDVFAECGMGAYNADVFRPHDGCHFNAKGYHRLGTFIGSKVIAAHSEWSAADVYPDETPIT